MATKRSVENVEMTENTVETGAVEKQAVNVLDLLLGSDCGVIKTPFKDVEISRLSEVFGSPFMVRCEALSPDMYEEIRDRALTISGKDVDLDMNDLQMFSVIEGVKAIKTDERGERVADGYLLKNATLMSHFKAPTPKELCKKLFLSGEVQKMYDTISDLSGFNDKSVVEVKN